MTVEGGNGTVGRYLDEGFERGFRACNSGTNDGQRPQLKFTFLRNVCSRHQSCASVTRPAARIAARMISICAPHRHKLYRSASSTSASEGCGLRISKAFVVMIMPLRQ